MLTGIPILRIIGPPFAPNQGFHFAHDRELCCRLGMCQQVLILIQVDHRMGVIVMKGGLAIEKV